MHDHSSLKRASKTHAHIARVPIQPAEMQLQVEAEPNLPILSELQLLKDLIWTDLE
jgi:hypothetical protein